MSWWCIFKTLYNIHVTQFIYIKTHSCVWIRVTGRAESSSLPRILCPAQWRTFGGWCGITTARSSYHYQIQVVRLVQLPFIDLLLYIFTNMFIRISFYVSFSDRQQWANHILACERSANQLRDLLSHIKRGESRVSVQWRYVDSAGLCLTGYAGNIGRPANRIEWLLLATERGSRDFIHYFM